MGQSSPFCEITDPSGGDEANYGARINRLGNNELVYFHRALSNPAIINDTIWLPRLEREMHRRGLINLS